jgi:lysozyme
MIAGLLAAAWWLWWVPNWRPSLGDSESYGIDVSAHQNDIDWRQVANDDIEFAYIKATEGGDFVDNRFADNWAGAAEAGLERGAYHFFTLCAPGDIQAMNFLHAAAPDPSALPPAVDLELAGNCADRPPPDEVLAELTTFLRIAEDAWNKEVILYVGSDFESRYPVQNQLDRPLWLRRFLLRPENDRWRIWQLHGYARVDGIQGGVDLDVMRVSP